MNSPSAAGKGSIKLSLHGRAAVFEELSYQYPLKLLSPRIHEDAVAIAYVLTYGGGLVSADCIDLDVDVRSGAILVMLTQGSTKVFKHRMAARLAIVTPDGSPVPSTVQRFSVDIRDNALLVLLPDPVTCFASASYNQYQTFRLHEGASAAILDWFTSGRMSRGEEWQFARYYSLNEIWVERRRVARDSLLLDGAVGQRSLKDRLGIYSCYATLFLCGPQVQHIVRCFESMYSSISIMQQPCPANLLWSLSRIENVGCVVRVAAKETEMVKSWLKENLNGLHEIIGIDVYTSGPSRGVATSQS